MPKLDKVYLDTCARLALINKEPRRFDQLTILYNLAKRTQINLWTSIIALVKAFRLYSEMHEPKPYPEEKLIDIDEISLQEFIKLVPVDMEISLDSRFLRRNLPNFGKLADSIHLATCCVWSLDYLITYDGTDLVNLDDKINKKNGNKLRILLPDAYLQEATFG